jgi:hypothetical protein
MKKLILLLLPFLGYSQAHLGHTEYEIRSYHTDVDFIRDWTKDGQKYLMGAMPLGTFIYYFDEKGYSNFNVQIPRTMKDANLQAEIYNGKYVIISKTNWTAYLEGGGIMKIEMVFDEKLNTFIFRYGY